MSELWVTNVYNQEGDGAPNFPNGATVTGIVTATTFKGGAEITGGSATFSGNVSIGGTLTYEDVTNIDSVGIVTARSGIKVTNGNILLTGGNGTKVSFAGDASSHYMKMDTALNGPVINGYGGIAFETAGTNERLRIGPAGQIGLGGANYGTAGQVLSSQGASAAPQWADAGGGLTEVIASAEVGPGDYGSKQIDLVGITTAYSKAKLVVSGLNFVGMVNGTMRIRFMLDGSSTPLSTNIYQAYVYREEIVNPGSNPQQYGPNFDGNKTEWQLQWNNNDRNWSFEIDVPVFNTSVGTSYNKNVAYAPFTCTPNTYWGREFCRVDSGAATRITGLRIFTSGSANFGVSGRLVLYGIKHS